MLNRVEYNFKRYYSQELDALCLVRTLVCTDFLRPRAVAKSYRRERHTEIAPAETQPHEDHLVYVVRNGPWQCCWIAMQIPDDAKAAN